MRSAGRSMQSEIRKMLLCSATIEVYSKERKAEFLLTNATDPDDYKAARQAVRDMGLDPDTVPHEHPSR